MEENEIQKKKDKLNEKEYDKIIFEIGCSIYSYNFAYIENRFDDLHHYMMDDILEKYDNFLYIYSNEKKDHLLWYMIRDMCDIISLKTNINILYKEEIEIDISNNIWPLHLYNNCKLYIKKGIEEIIQFNYFLIMNDKLNDFSLNESQKEHFINLLDKYCELFDVSYKKCTFDEYMLTT